MSVENLFSKAHDKKYIVGLQAAPLNQCKTKAKTVVFGSKLAWCPCGMSTVRKLLK